MRLIRRIHCYRYLASSQASSKLFGIAFQHCPCHVDKWYHGSPDRITNHVDKCECHYRHEHDHDQHDKCQYDYKHEHDHLQLHYKHEYDYIQLEQSDQFDHHDQS
jgi:hypothetical protein